MRRRDSTEKREGADPSDEAHTTPGPPQAGATKGSTDPNQRSEGSTDPRQRSGTDRSIGSTDPNGSRKGGRLHSQRGPGLHESALSPKRATYTHNHRLTLDHHYEGNFDDGVYDCKAVLAEHLPRPEAAPQRRQYVIELVYVRNPDAAGPMAEHRAAYRSLLRRVLRDVKESADKRGWDWFVQNVEVLVTTRADIS